MWQEARKRSWDPEPTYVLEDAVRFVRERLDPEVRERLRSSDVRRILEWELFYLQGLAQEKRWRPVETVAGGPDPAVEYITEQIRDRHGVSYAREHIRAVLHREVEYLVSIGAVGDRVEDETAGGDER